MIVRCVMNMLFDVKKFKVSLLCGLLVLSVPVRSNPTDGHDGFINISTENFERGDVILIKNKWEFYWKKLLTPDSFKITHSVPLFLETPGPWHIYRINGENLPIYGYGTYRLTIYNPDRIEGLMLKFTGISSSCKIWMDDALVTSLGRVSNNKEEEVAKRAPVSIALPPGDTTVLVIQVSNFHYLSGGITAKILLGKEQTIRLQESISENIEMSELGILAIITLYAVILYIQFHRGTGFLIIALICLTVLYNLMAAYDGSLMLFRIFPNIDFIIAKRVQFALFAVNIFLIPMFIKNAFPDEGLGKSIAFFKVSALMIVGCFIFSPGYLLRFILNLDYLLIVTAFCFVLWIVLKAGRNNKPGAKYICAGVFICLICISFDILEEVGYISINNYIAPNVVTIGFIFFLIFQSMAVTSNFAKAFDESENWSRHLEQEVQKRTEKLSAANYLKDKLFSIISHDLRSPMNSLNSIVNLFTVSHIETHEIKALLPSLKQALQNCTQLLENLLAWSTMQMKGIKLKPEKSHIYQLVEDGISLYRNLALNKEIQLINKVSPVMTINADTNMVRLVLRNLIANAIKFTPEKGKIEISATVDNSWVWVAISDSGVGMTYEAIESVFKTGAATSTSGTNNEKGTGIGLLLCRECIEQNGGEITVKSEPGKGTTFRFSLKCA